jgi:hypothetical protein
MSTTESNSAVSIAAIAGVVIVVAVGLVFGIDDTLVKLGIAVIAGLAGFSLSRLIR